MVGGSVPLTQWIVGVMSYQRIYGFNSVKWSKVEKRSGWVGFGWAWWVMGHDVSGQWISG